MRMTNKEINRWEKVREKGRKNYIWRVGVLGFGLSIGLGITIASLVTRDSNFLEELCIRLVIFPIYPICGYGFGYFMWKYMDKKYQQAKSEEESCVNKM